MRVFPNPWNLSPRQGQVVGLVGAGRSNKEIAQELGISLRTVEVILWNAYRRMGGASRAQAAVMYAQWMRDSGAPA